MNYEPAEKPRFKCFHCGQPYIYKCEADCSNDPSIPKEAGF